MPAAKTSRKPSSRRAARSSVKPAAAPALKSKGKARPSAVNSAAKSSGSGASFDEVIRDLERAGTEQARKTYLRHGAKEPLFGVSFATLKEMVKRIGVDHDLANQLWQTGNHDARILAMKIADPARCKPADLDRWARETRMRMCGGYVSMLAAEGPHGHAKAREWLASNDAGLRAAGWLLVGYLATLDEAADDAWFTDRLAAIEKTIHSASNSEREAMNSAVIAIGGRNASLRKAATAAAKRIGPVEVDHGDTACKTPDAAGYIEKTWAHATAKKFASPAAQERAREPMRTRC